MLDDDGSDVAFCVQRGPEGDFDLPKHVQTRQQSDITLYSLLLKGRVHFQQGTSEGLQ